MIPASPKYLWQIFDALRQIPRPSGREEKVGAWILAWAQDHGLETKTDAVGNICIHVPASPGYEDAPVVCIQNHKDMVCVQEPGRNFDFDNEAIELKRDGRWLKAVGTTLGADNGVGLAAAMAVAIDPQVQHGPLEILVTTEEETTFKGAFGLDAAALGMRATHLLNLDGEEFGDVYIGSAGMQALSAELNLSYSEQEPDWQCFEIDLTGLPGGHSGAEIHENRGNAILSLIAMIDQLEAEFKLVSIDGGQAKNAIPPNAKAVISVANTVKPTSIYRKLENTPAYKELKADHLRMQLVVKKLNDCEAMPMSAVSQTAVIASLLDVPDGLVSMHKEIPNLVETSTNLGVIRTRDGQVYTEFAVRSAINTEMQTVAEAIRQIMEQNGFRVEGTKSVPAWEGDPESALVKLAVDAFREITGQPGKPMAIHAGLEVGPISERLEAALGHKIEAAAFGPDIVNPHSPDEAVDIETVELFYEQLKVVLKKLR